MSYITILKTAFIAGGMACLAYYALSRPASARDIAITLSGWKIQSGQDAMDDKKYLEAVTAAKVGGDNFLVRVECNQNKGGVLVDFSVELTSARAPNLAFQYTPKEDHLEGWVDVRGDGPKITRKFYTVKYVNQAQLQFADEMAFRESINESGPLAKMFADSFEFLLPGVYNSSVVGPPDVLITNKSLRIRLATNDGIDRTLILNLADPQFRKFLSLCGVE